MATIPEALAIALEHHQAGRLQAAEEIYRQILAVAPQYADALHLLGVLACQVGNHEVAVEYIRTAIGVDDTQAVFHYNLGEAYCALRRHCDAADCYRRAIQRAPEFAAAYNSLGSALQSQGDLDEAIASFQQILHLKPDFAEAHYNLGNALRERGQAAEAIACYRRAVSFRPDYVPAYNNLGSALQDQGQLDEAVACFRQALELKPDFAAACYNLGNALKTLGQTPQAIEAYQQALRLDPNSAETHCNLGIAWKDEGKLDEALECFRRALRLRPQSAEAYCNMGIVARTRGSLGEAMDCFRRSLEAQPDYADGHLNQSLLRLVQGDFAGGWPQYRWRWRTKQSRPRSLVQPEWTGQALAGRTILLHAEQGLGDTVQFVRYAALVKALGARVVVECQRPLLRLLASCPGIDQLVGQGDELPPFDVHAPLLGLPGIFHTDLTNIPATIPYLSAAPDLIQRWRERLGGLAGWKIGICWQGSPAYPDDRYRSIPLAEFGPLSQLSGVCLISLQKGPREELLPPAGEGVAMVDFTEELDEASGAFMDTAAVMKSLDLVITADSSLGHLAGALGVPVWIALPLVPDWRWLLGRDDSPWYTTVRLFRQKRLSYWRGVFEQMAEALRDRMQCPGLTI